MASRNQTRNASLVNAIVDTQQTVRVLAAKAIPERLADGSVTTSKIQAKAVTTSVIEDGAVNSDKIANDAVGPAQIADNAVGTAAIAPDAVGPDEIADNAVGRAAISPDAVGPDEIADGAVGSSAIANNAVGSAQIANEAVGSSEIAYGAVGTDHIADVSITSSKLSSNSVYWYALQPTVRSQFIVGISLYSSGTPMDPSPLLLTSGGEVGTYLGILMGPYYGYAAKGDHTHGTSSIKLKKNISDYEISNLDLLFKLQPKKFQYKESTRGDTLHREWNHGYIAEEVLELGLEEIVGYDHDGEPESLNYALLSVWVLELVKRQQTEINQLKEDVKNLREEIRELRQMVQEKIL